MVKRSENLIWCLYILVFVGIIATFWMIRQTHPFGVDQWRLPSWTIEKFLSPLESYVGSWSLVAIGVYPFGVLGILVLERIIPARPDQKILSTGLAHDAVWALIRTSCHLLIIIWYIKLLRFLYQPYQGFLTVVNVEELPGWLRFVWAVLLVDLSRWCSHYLRHKIPLFWCFHAVHHSQRELNLFSDYRSHFMDDIISQTFMILALMMFSVPTHGIIAFSLFMKWHARFYHGNIKSNFGPLRYLLVTPQSHRVHHSLKEAHRDRNFGGVLSVWDHLFGTQYRAYDEYPNTGIADPDFPSETSASVRNILITPLRQMIYPFRQIGQRFFSRVR